MPNETSKKVLIIEDEVSISDIIKFNLTKEGYDTETAYDGADGLEKALKGNADLILLDVMLPKMDGFEVCKRVREVSTVPILMLTAKEEEVDKVLGLELGADDYITKPFGMRELLARIKANIRRTDVVAEAQAEPVSSDIKLFGDLSLDMNRFEVKKGGKTLDLTLREFELLKYLAEREDRVFSREQLLEEVWGYEYYGDIRTVDVTVRRLREKLEDDPGDPKFILTRRGIGYYFRRP